MRRPRVLPVLLLAVLLAGCAEPGPSADGTAPTPGRADDDAAPFLAYRASAQGPGDAHLTVFALRSDGTAVKVMAVDEGSAAIAAAPGLDYPVDGLRVLFTPAGGNLNRTTGGTVLRVEEGHVPAAQFALAAETIATRWRHPPTNLDDPRGDDYVRFLPGGGAEVVRAPTDPSFGDVVQAFHLAEAAFVPERFHEAAPATPTPSDGFCVQSALEPESEALHAGGSLLVRATATNCGTGPLRIGETPCDADLLWTVSVVRDGFSWQLPPVPWAHPAMPPRLGCEGERPVIELAPGESATAERRWDGAFLDCAPGAAACEPTPAEPGRYSIASWVTGQAETRGAEVIVLPPESNLNRTLLVTTREWSWVNRTQGEGSVLADFGPHCSPARLTSDPPTITLLQAKTMTVPEATLHRDLRAGGRPENMSTVGEGTVVERLGNATLAVASAYNGSRALFNLSYQDGEALVDGEPLGADETRAFRLEQEIEERGARFRVTEIAMVSSLGRVPVLTQEPGPCA